uniref:Apolipoprotein M n=1 Tax=Myripristis murdjan TaxID=586833 RepID=A0A668AZV5_9TELE
MFAVCATVLLYLTSGSHSAPLSCEELVRPLDQLEPHHLEGRWALVAGSLSHPASLDALKLRDSITMYFLNSSETSTTSYTQINRFGDLCQNLPYNISMKGSTFSFDVGNRFNLTGTFLQTSCPDCMVMRWDVESKRRVSLDLYLISRRRELELKEMEEYKAQLECLNLPPPVMMDPTKELCPEQTSSEPAAAQTQEKTDKQQA